MRALVAPRLVVVDASLVAKWFLEEPFSDRAAAVAQHWAVNQTQPIAPRFMLTEVTNAIYKRVIRGLLPLEEAITAVEEAVRLRIAVDEDPPLHRDALLLAHRFGRPSTYDAHYLALAEREKCELWTGDERLYNAVHQSIPWIRWIGTYRPG